MSSVDSAQAVPVGALLIRSAVKFQAYLSPDAAIEPGSAAFEVYEQLERILQNGSEDKELFKQIETVFDFVESIKSNSVPVFVYPLGGVVWQVAIQLEDGAELIPLIQLSLPGHSLVDDQPSARSGTSLKLSTQSRLTVHSQDGHSKEMMPKAVPSDASAVDTSIENASASRSVSVISAQSLVSLGEETKIYALAACELEILMGSLRIGTVAALGRQTHSQYLSQVSLISRQHLEVRRLGENQFVVTDLNSTNGTAYLSSSGAWVPLEGSQTLYSGAKLRLGAQGDCVIFEIPGPQSDLVYLQGRLAAAIATMSVGTELLIGSQNSELQLHLMPKMPEEVVTIKRHSAGDYVITPLTSELPVYVQKGPLDEVMPLEGAIWLRAGAAIVLGDESVGVRVYLPGLLSNYIKDVPAFEDLAVGRSQVHLDIAEFAAISRNHAVFTLLPDRSVLVEDLGSTNGTFYRDTFESWKRILRFARVKIGQEIMLGSRSKALILTVPA